MKYKKIIVLVILLVSLLAISVVSAAENVTNNDVIDSTDDTVVITITNDVNTIGELNEDDVEYVGESNKNILKNKENDKNCNVLKAKEGNMWYVNTTADYGGDGKSEATAFQTLKVALDVANDEDTIMIASGTYAGTNNTGLIIDKKLSFEKCGEGDVIFDAWGKSRIFTVNATSININGLTFKNGNASIGGAIYFEKRISNSNINAIFINNTATGDGGANYFYGGVLSSNICGTYINNTADRGGANYLLSVSYSNMCGTYINNTATAGGANSLGGLINSNMGGIYSNNKAKFYGGVNCFRGMARVLNSNISGIYINNTARQDGGVNYFGTSVHVSKSNISGIYINNTARQDGGVNYFMSVISSNICGTYINNTANRGGANYFHWGFSSSNICGTYINNTANRGGANYFYNGFDDSYICGTYINNTATGDGGVNYFFKGVDKSYMGGTYINNTAGTSIIYFHSSEGNIIISNAVFLNNKYGTYVIHVAQTTSGGHVSVYANNNWFGNNATNYKNRPEGIDFNIRNWLFLNATAVPNELEVSEGSTITFKLQSYNILNSQVSEYDSSKMNIKLNLAQTLGELNQTTALMGEKILYSAKNGGYAVVTGKFENASYAINLKNKDGTIRDASVSVNNSTVDLFVKDTFAIVATVPNGLKVTYVPDDSGVVSVSDDGVVTALKNGTAKITVKVGGDGVYAENSTIVTVTVSKIPSEIIVKNTDISMMVRGYDILIDATLNPIEAGNLIYKSSDESVVIVKNGLIQALAEGTATVTVSFTGNEQYAPAENKTIKVTVNLYDASVSVNNSTVDLFVKDTFAIVATVPNGLKVTYVPDDSGVVSVSDDGVVTALKNGTAKITVKVGGDGVYAENSTIVTVTVSKIPSEIIVKNTDISMMVRGYDILIDATLNPIEAGNLIYKSSDESVVIVKNGLIQALAEGTATVTVSFTGNEQYAPAENKTIKVTVNLKQTTVKVNADNSVYGNNVIVKVTASEKGKVTVQIGNIVKSVNVDANKVTSVDFGILDVNSYEVSATFDGGKNFNTSSDKGSFEISPKNTAVSLNVKDYNVDEKVIVNLTASENGKATIKLGNVIKNVDVIANKIASLDFGVLSTGSYDVVATFTAGNNYIDTSDSANIKVLAKIDEKDIDISIPEIKPNQENNIVINLPEDATGTVTLIIGDNAYTFNVKNGIANINVPKLDEGNYEYVINYSGDSKYSSFENTGSIDVAKPDPEIVIPPLDKPSEDGSVAIKLPSDATGTVTLVIDGKVYSFPVVNGVANVYMPELNDGNYNYSITYSGDGKYSPFTTGGNLNIIAPKITAKNTAVQYSAKGKYSVTVYGTDGKVANGAEVIFKISGKQVGKAKTNTKGVASYVVTKNPGKYKIQATALGKSLTKTVTVKHIVTLKTVTLKKSAKKLTLQATLAKVNGKYLKKKTITFKINGKKVATAKTNSKGVAKITIKNPSVVKKLKVGKKVTYQATYLKDTVKKTAKIKK